MRNKGKREYLQWKRIADKIQKSILSNEEAVRWWLDNINAIYDQNIEYPISEVLPLCESVTSKYTKLLTDNLNLITKVNKLKYSNEELGDLLDCAAIQERLYQDLYWWNLDNTFPSSLQIKLKPYMLEILKAKFIDNIKLTNYARINGYVDNYPHRVMSEIRKIIRDYLRSKQTK